VRLDAGEELSIDGTTAPAPVAARRRVALLDATFQASAAEHAGPGEAATASVGAPGPEMAAPVTAAADGDEAGSLPAETTPARGPRAHRSVGVPPAAAVAPGAGDAERPAAASPATTGAMGEASGAAPAPTATSAAAMDTRLQAEAGAGLAREAPQPETFDPRATLRAARAAWKQGRSPEALGLLEELTLRRAVEPAVREDALYLTADIHRSERRFGEAAAALAALADGSASPAARLARLERARLLVRELGRGDEAMGVLASLAYDGATDLPAREGTFELCALLLDRAAHERAEACLAGFLARFPGGPRTSEARDLLDRLRAR
jgi:hypothetical protein